MSQLPYSSGAPPEWVSNHPIAQEIDFARRIQTARPWVTYSIIATCIAVYLLELHWRWPDEKTVIGMGALAHDLVMQGEWWRLLASTFLHGNGLHLGMNMYGLYVLGPQLEAILGKSRYIILYTLSGLAGAVASIVVHKVGLSVGASGAIWGLMTAYAGMTFRPDGVIPTSIAKSMRSRVWLPIAINVGISFIPGIDAWAHLGGGILGFLLLFSGILTIGMKLGADNDGKAGTLLKASAIISALALFGSLFVAIIQGSPWTISQ